jgi:hypothetical protein
VGASEDVSDFSVSFISMTRDNMVIKHGYRDSLSTLFFWRGITVGCTIHHEIVMVHHH